MHSDLLHHQQRHQRPGATASATTPAPSAASSSSTSAPYQPAPPSPSAKIADACSPRSRPTARSRPTRSCGPGRRLASTWNNYDTSLAWTTAGCGGSGTDRRQSGRRQRCGHHRQPGRLDRDPDQHLAGQGWVNGSITNNGVLLKDTNETGCRDSLLPGEPPDGRRPAACWSSTTQRHPQPRPSRTACCPNTSYAGCEDNWMHSSASHDQLRHERLGQRHGRLCRHQAKPHQVQHQHDPSAATVTSAKLRLKITVADASKTRRGLPGPAGLDAAQQHLE